MQRCCTRLGVTHDTVNAFLLRACELMQRSCSELPPGRAARVCAFGCIQRDNVAANTPLTCSLVKSLGRAAARFPPGRRGATLGELSSDWGARSGDRHGHSGTHAHFGPAGGGHAMMAGWAYLMAGIMTVDALLLGLLLMNVKWPKRWKKNG